MQKAQGTIEYLIILSVIIVVGLIVVSLMINSTSGVSATSQGISKLEIQSAPLALTETIISPDGNYFLKIKNNK
jgi:hypothetical protein